LGNLEIQGANRAIGSDGILQVNSNNSQAIDLGGSISFGGVWQGTSVTEWASVSGRKENSTSSQYGGYLSFGTRPHLGVITERMRITPGGSLQINYNPGGGDLYFRDTTNGAVMFYIIPATYVGTAPFNSNKILAANSSDISFETGGAERMRITSEGKVIVRQSNFTYPVSIEAQSGGGQLALTRSGAYAEFYMGGSTGGGTQLYVRSGGSGGVRLDAGSTGWVADSDIRLKDIEKPIENAVQSLSTLQTIYYSWKDSENKSLHLGLIAQEVEAVFPEIVSESSISNMKGVNYMELIPVLIKATQEQQSQMESLKSENDELKSILQRNNIV
jgi:hypothetical protein